MVRLIGLLVCLFLVVGGAWRVVGAQDAPPPVATVVVESPLVTPTYAGGPAPATIPSPSPTATPSPTLTPTTTPTATPSETPTPTLSPTATATATPTPTYAPFQVSPLLTLTDTPTNAGDFTLLWLGAAALLLVLGSGLLVWGDRAALNHAGVKLEFNSKFPDENLFARVAQGTILFMPQTLHAAWLRHDEPFADGKLFFWAETLDFQPGSRLELPAASAGGDLRNGVSGTCQRTHKTPSHPGQLPVNQLRTVLGEEVSRLPINDMQPATTSVWLPSRGGMPLARRGLLQANQGARSVETGAVTLQNWQISGLALPPLPALVFLSQLRQPGRRWTFPPATRLERLRMGNDLLYWSNAAKFVLEILIGQHYIPSVRMDDAGVLYALWQPALLDDRIKRRFGALVESMPAVCRAYALEQVGDALSPMSSASISSAACLMRQCVPGAMVRQALVRERRPCVGYSSCMHPAVSSIYPHNLLTNWCKNGGLGLSSCTSPVMQTSASPSNWWSRINRDNLLAMQALWLLLGSNWPKSAPIGPSATIYRRGTIRGCSSPQPLCGARPMARCVSATDASIARRNGSWLAWAPPAGSFRRSSGDSVRHGLNLPS